mgnify:CR=1 FL=1
MKKNVLIVQSFGCARSHKIASGLGDKGWKVSLAQMGIKIPLWGFNFYDQIISLGKEECTHKCWEIALESIVNYTDRWDVIHSSNTPDGFSVFLDSISKTPVIHDCHDALTTFRHRDSSQVAPAEFIAVQRADGVIFVSEGQRDYICDTHGVDRDKTLVFHNYCLGKYISKYPKTKLSDLDGNMHLVWEGGIKIGGEDNAEWSDHRDIWPLIKLLIKQGIHIHIYSANRYDRRKNYLPVNSPLLHWHGAVPLSTLMRDMTQYDAGIVAFNKTYELFLDHTLPNKMFEYVGAGLPVLTDDCRDVKKWVEKYGVGEASLSGWREGSIDKINFNNVEPYISNVEKYRWEWTIEKNIHRLEKFYAKIARRGR